jgi:hypothetical protein
MTMPNYRYGQVDPTEQYQGSSFNPMTGRLNGAQLVMEFINRMQADKERKQQEQWALQDRAFQEQLRPLQLQQAQQGIAKNQLDIENYQPPESPAMQRFIERAKDRREQKQALERIEATARANKEAKTPTVTDYDKKVGQAKSLYKAGKITEQEYNRIVTGYTGEETEKERKAMRLRIASDTRRAIAAGIKGDYHKDPKDAEMVKNSLGIDLYMPEEYNVAQKMISADVADESDYDIVKKYGDLQRFYQEKLKPTMTLKQLIKSDFYKGLEPELKAALVQWYRLKL